MTKESYPLKYLRAEMPKYRMLENDQFKTLRLFSQIETLYVYDSHDFELSTTGTQKQGSGLTLILNLAFYYHIKLKYAFPSVNS